MSLNRLLLFSQTLDIGGVSLTESQLDTLEAYYDAVIDAGKDFNLTAITQKDEFLAKHYIDSFTALPYIPSDAKLLDVGSGAGFPAFPLAVARADISVTALDSTAKKMHFVGETARALGVKNLSTLIGRAEDLRPLYGTFDVVVARAVASLPILLEICTPLLKVGGSFIAYKTDESELNISKSAAKILSCTYTAHHFSLPSGDRRCLIIFKKTRPTPDKYPRQYGQIKKSPL